jgi:hypothetical protein
MKIVLVSRDLMFISRVKEVALAHGHHAVIAKNGDALSQAVSSRVGDERGVLLMDLEKAPLSVSELQEVVRTLSPEHWTCISFYSHVHLETAEEAKGAQLGQVMPRSRFVQVLPQLFAV